MSSLVTCIACLILILGTTPIFLYVIGELVGIELGVALGTRIQVPLLDNGWASTGMGTDLVVDDEGALEVLVLIVGAGIDVGFSGGGTTLLIFSDASGGDAAGDAVRLTPIEDEVLVVDIAAGTAPGLAVV
jgi:hypothetical protein